ncbi:hypothetical protein L3Q82_006961 [Scortum barcoo]|uniref:Uncharacterized protein n=1 Tax=Scortum barcoo TaxID=214431 RepID=A0ACB8WW89_9TELE|nr:hypothetical protein L3Q82_006961 [Scortum barcoo]
MNNTSWRPQSCQECTCYGDLAICSPPRCPNPQCDFQRAERLRIPANKCCPECVSSSQGSCQHEGVTYAHDSQWSPSPCSSCVCSGGIVSCSARPCPPLNCPGDQSPFIPAGECCPKCGRNGESCSWQGSVYRDGEEWKPSLCSRCVCSSGEVHCSVAECQQVACKPHGEQWQKNACTTCVCVCDRGQSRCHTHTCRPVTCDKGHTKVKRAGQCCDECAAAKGSCLYEGAVRYHGDMWNGTGCEFCTCNRGQVVCRRAECGRVECPQDLARWTDRDCRECECHDAQVTCYLHSCPTCPPGTLAVTQEGRCCPECRQD